MRFLLFNLVVAGALFYLFTADKTGVQSAAGAAHSVIDKIEDLATKTVAKVNIFNEDDKNGATQAVGDGPRGDEAWRKIEKTLARIKESAEAPAPPEGPRLLVAEDKGQEKTDDDEKKNPPTDVADSDLPLRLIPDRPVQVVPRPDGGAARREIAIAEGETLMTPLERRRELQALAQKMEFMFLRKAVE
jgi:hypothetical protein